MTDLVPHADESLARWLATISVDALENDPYPIFERLRREAPVAWLPAVHAWVASTWEACTVIANDEDSFRGGTSPMHERVLGPTHILGAEGEVHRGLRSAVDPPLRPRSFRPLLESLVRPTARACLEKIRRNGRADLMAEYFEPISVRSVGDIIGFPEVDSDTLRRWFHSLAQGIANTAMDAEGRFTHPEGFAPAEAAGREIREFVEPKVAELTADPDDSALSHYLHDGMAQGEVRSLEHLLPSLHVMILGGLQEPGHQCAATLLGLFSEPEQLQRVIDSPTLLGRALNEGLRWMAPVFSASSRIPTRDVEIAGATVHAGQTVWLSYGSANRDETQFTNSARFDLDRPAHPHLAFGTGRHACSGSAYAPQVARIALEELFAAIPTVELDHDRPSPTWGWLFRGPTELNVVWR